jgi:hypothetical protein
VSALDSERLRNAMARAGFVMHDNDAERIVEFYAFDRALAQPSPTASPILPHRAASRIRAVLVERIEESRGEDVDSIDALTDALRAVEGR